MSGPPPPPPPHGESPKTTAGGGSGLPPGKYDVFIIPDHSAGGGFLYLPSLRPNTNSFIAGFASALFIVVVGQTLAPAFQAWWANFQGMGNAGMALLVVAVGLGAWALGRQTSDSSGRGAGGWGGGGFYSGGPGGASGFSGAGPSPHGPHHGAPPNAGPPPDAQSPPPPGGSKPGASNSNGSYQRPPDPPPKPQPTSPQPDASKKTWEKAREEVRRKEEERKAKEAEEKRRAEAAQRLKELREKEARERAQREADRARREQEAREKAAKEQEARDREARLKAAHERKEREIREAQERKERELREARERELKERLARDREERRKRVEAERKRKEEESEKKRKEEEAEKKRQEEAEKKRKEEEEATKAHRSSTYAFSGVGEKLNPWPNGKPPSVAPSPPPAANKPPPPPSATSVGDDADAYSYRPYDQPKRSTRRTSNSDMSESSWAPSQSTSRTTPPPSVRSSYSTKDPDKIVIKGVYSFVNQYAKTPASQLLPGFGTLSDGLILRITTEGLFIDDDVRGIAQREWDVKTWTLKLIEVWCPMHFLIDAIAANSPPSPSVLKSSNPALHASNISTAFFAKMIGGSAKLRAAERTTPKPMVGDEADEYLTGMLRSCKDSCRLGDCASKFAASNLPAPSATPNDDTSSMASGSTRLANNASQTGDYKAKGLHLLRATVRDNEGKRYLFIIGEEEGWKLSLGIQRLRRGTQARALGVAALSGLETKTTIDMLGWG